MSTVSASSIQSLRLRTGVSISACKEALEEAGGDEEKAIEVLRKRGIAQAAKKASRAQAEGLIFLASEGNVSASFALRCETDFVARDEQFQQAGQRMLDALLHDGASAALALSSEIVPVLVQKLGENISADDMQRIEAPVCGTYLHSNRKIGVIIGMEGGTQDIARDIAMHAAALSPRYVRPEEVTSDVLEQERTIWKELLKKEGKPEQMWDVIMKGKERKFRDENALLKQAFVKDPSKTVEEYLGDARITAYVRLAIG